jgi:hypothetical protein
MNASTLTAEKLCSLLDYNAETGVFVWLASTNGRIKAGDIAGYTNNKGYLVIECCGYAHKAHRLAWMLAHGVWPKFQIDHIDGDKMNNRLENLREATNTENQWNRHQARKDNQSTGIQGVGIHQKTKKYIARISANGKRIFLGLFDTAERAHEAYVNAKRRLHSGCPM